MPITEVKKWLASAWAREPLLAFDSGSLCRQLADGLDRERRGRLWAVLCLLPTFMFGERVDMLAAAIETLCVRRDSVGPSEVKAWQLILQRAKRESAEARYLVLCGQAVQYALSNCDRPVSALLLTAFADLHDAVVVNARTAPDVSSVIGNWHWDKAGELRRLLVERFCASSWPPGELAVIGVGRPLLKKIFKRLRRHWNGDKYLNAMFDDLGRMEGAGVAEARRELAELLRRPEFPEEWD